MTLAESPDGPDLFEVGARLRAEQQAAKAAASERAAQQLAATGVARAGDNPSYVEAALQREADEIRTAPEGQRNVKLNYAAWRMGGYIAAGHLTPDHAREILTHAARACGLTALESARTITSGFAGGATEPRNVPAPSPSPQPDVTVVEASEIAAQAASDADQLWQQRDLLHHLHATARARRVAPWAVLGITLARIITATSPAVVLPPLTGGVASLNSFIGIVGPSGVGKGAAEATAATALDVGKVTIHKAGSGEGIAHAYMRRTKNALEQHETAVLFSLPEIDSLAALGSRQGATLMPELRSAWSGEALGFAYSDPAKRLPVNAHEYRLCLVTGIQPGRAGNLLDDADGGTPQRFVWLPALDRDAPATQPDCPTPKTWAKPLWASSFGQVQMDVCGTARAQIDANRLAKLRGEQVEGVTALDGHGDLCRLKLAAALALMESRMNIQDDDWELAGIIHGVSLATRGGVEAVLRQQQKVANEARAEAEANRAARVRQRGIEDDEKRVARAIVNKLKPGPLRRAELRKKLASRDRDLFDYAIDRAVEVGLVTVETTEYRGQHAEVFALVDAVDGGAS